MSKNLKVLSIVSAMVLLGVETSRFWKESFNYSSGIDIKNINKERRRNRRNKSQKNKK